MIGRMMAVCISICSMQQSFAWSWADWWLTPNQQGQRLMQKGQFEQAKALFTQKDWAATAAYRSGDYARAVELLKNETSEQDSYNLGNALAHLGRYEEAIAAYDKALAVNPKNEDALYNRKLVSELMKKDKNKEQNKDQQNKDQQNKDQQSKDQQSKDQQNKDQQNKDQQSKDQQSKDQQNKDQQNKDQQNKDQQNKDQQNKDQQNKDQQNKDQQGKDQQDKDQQNKDKQKDKSKEDNADAAQATQSTADQEKQLAKEQWLRLIPDDPGGLLREKFLRDHLRRERGWYQ